MERRRALGSVVAEMGKEWKILLDKAVEDNSITQYLINAQGCTEFYVSIFFANDADITNTCNGCISINTENAWGSFENRVTGNIQNLAYNANGNNNKCYIFRFEIVDRYVIPMFSMASGNTGASSTQVSPSNATPLALAKENGALQFIKVVESVKNIAIGSYAKYFGVGSKIFVMGR